MQAQFVAPLKSEVEARERTRAAHSERTSRIQDNKHTHLVLGFHSSPPLSEKVSNTLGSSALQQCLVVVIRVSSHDTCTTALYLCVSDG